MINRNRDSNSVLSPRIHHSSPSASALYPHSPTARMRHSSSASYPYPRSSSTTHHIASPSPSLYTPTRTEVVREEPAQCEGMDSVIQYDDVQSYFDRVGLPTSASMPERTRNPHNMSSSPRLSTVAMPLPLAPIVGCPTPNALRPPLLSLPAMKSLTPPRPVHQDMQYSPASSSHYCHPSSSSSHSRNRNGQSITSGSHNTTHTMPPAPVPGSSLSVRYTQPKPGSSAHSHRGGVHATRTRGGGRTAHTKERSTSKGIRIVTIYDVCGFEGVEPDPQFPNMMVVDRTGGEPMVVYRSGDVSGIGAGYDMHAVSGRAGNHDQSWGQ